MKSHGKDVWRNPNKVGMVYGVERMHFTHRDQRIREGDVVLCLEHTGDCHYTWALLKETAGNNTTRYFDIEKIYSSYGVEGEKLLEIPFSAKQLLRSVLALHFSGRSAVLIRRPEEEIEELKKLPCLLCKRTG